MLVKCPECGAHVPRDVAIEVPVADGVAHYCSTACVDAAEREGVTRPEVQALPDPPRRILVPTDGSGPAFRAVRQAAALARLAGGQVVLLHAVGGGWLRTLGTGSAAAAAVKLGIRSEELARALEGQADAQLDRGRRICEEAGVPCTVRIALDPPLDAILEAAEGADLVVMGSRGLDAISGTVLGSLSQRVVGSAPVPVLVVH
jgi:nucleotide-binding universal stress UspA family protein